ncbi:hypothetical protein GEMRC1_003585 [Eukaryota sp. GEM-RC1]
MWKCIHILEKGLLLALSVVLVHYLTVEGFAFLLSFFTIGFVFTMGLISRPLSDSMEVIMDNFSRFSATFTAFFGWVMTLELATDTIKTVMDQALMIVHLFNGMIMIVIVTLGPIRSFISVRKMKNSFQAAKALSGDSTENNNSLINVSGATVANTGMTAAGVMLREKGQKKEEGDDVIDVVVDSD